MNFEANIFKVVDLLFKGIAKKIDIFSGAAEENIFYYKKIFNFYLDKLICVFYNEMNDKLLHINFKGVIFMKKFRRKKLAFALACASILGGKSQAMDKNKPQSRQTLAAVGGGG